MGKSTNPKISKLSKGATTLVGPSVEKYFEQKDSPN